MMAFLTVLPVITFVIALICAEWVSANYRSSILHQAIPCLLAVLMFLSLVTGLGAFNGWTASEACVVALGVPFIQACRYFANGR